MEISCVNEEWRILLLRECMRVVGRNVRGNVISVAVEGKEREREGDTFGINLLSKGRGLKDFRFAQRWVVSQCSDEVATARRRARATTDARSRVALV